MSKPKIIIVLLIISFLINSLSIISGSLNWTNQFWIIGILFLISGIFKNNYVFKGNKIIYPLIILLPFTLIYTSFVLLTEKTHVYPIAFLPFVTFAIGCLISNKTIKTKIISTVFSGGLIVILAIFGIPNWQAYVWNKNNTDLSLKQNTIEFFDKDKKLHSLDSNTNKIIVLDFWGTYCPICYKKFLEFKLLKDRFDGDIIVYAVHLIDKREIIDDVIIKAEKLDYSFPFAFTNLEQTQKIRKLFDVSAVPTIAIINTNGDLIYKGQLITNEKIIFNNAITIIENELSQ
jgi:thiol-disulfide isomerase/thioredoxin